MKFIENRPSEGQGPHYTPGVVSGNLLFVSGQLSIDPVTREIPKTIGEEAALALKNLDNVLKVAGLSKNKVVSCRVYVTSIDYWDEVDAVYAKYFGEHRPARAIVPVLPLHFGCNIEIEAVAELT